MRDPLTDFLLARYAEDSVAVAAAMERSRGSAVGGDSTVGTWPIYRRAMAECEAKRQLIEEAFIVQAGSTEVAYIGDNVRKRAIYPSALAMLKALATVYADHPDYRPEWKP